MTLWIVVGCLSILVAVVFALMRRIPSPMASRDAANADGPTTDIKALTCSCDQWVEARSRFRQGDPRRLCEHLCEGLSREIMLMPESLVPFAQLVSRLRDEGRGMPYAPPTFAFVLGDSGYLITMTPDAKPWATVYVGGSDYAFNVDTGQWGDAGRPPFASDIGSLIQSEVRRRSQKQQENAESDA